MLKQKNEITENDKNPFLLIRVLHIINLCSFNLQFLSTHNGILVIFLQFGNNKQKKDKKKTYKARGRELDCNE